MPNIERLERKAEKIAVNLARAHIEALKQIWIEQHALRRGDKAAAKQARCRRLDIETQIRKLETKFSDIYTDLALQFSILFANGEAIPKKKEKMYLA